MATQADVLATSGEPLTVTWKVLVVELGRLIGVALLVSLVIGLLFTAAALAVPAALVR